MSDDLAISFTVLLAASMHEDGMTLDNAPLGFGSTDSRLKNLYSDNR